MSRYVHHVLCVFSFWISSPLRSQHAPQQQQLVDGGGRNDPRSRCGETRNREEVGIQHVQGQSCMRIHISVTCGWISPCYWCSRVPCSVHEADDLGAVRSGVPDRGPGARGPDRGAERHQEEIWEHAAIGPSAHQPLLQHGADAARAGRHVRWPQPEISRATSEASNWIKYLLYHLS